MNAPAARTPTANAMAVVRAVALLGFGATAREVCAYLRMPPASVYRILNGLVGDEYLVRTGDLHGFGLGRAAAELVQTIAPPVVTTAARDAIDAFRVRVRFGVHVLEFRDLSLLVADEDADHPIQARVELTRALHASAPGKLLLAQTPDWRTRRAGALTQLTPGTITDPDALERELAGIRAAGMATDVGELVAGRACLAVPIGGDRERAHGALCVTGPAERADVLTGLADEARAVARALAPLLY
ncbi:IclR family transcriptional regulator [Microbacterium lacusdiani]|jgi:DNA-binding IclR family transcriptional regulator